MRLFVAGMVPAALASSWETQIQRLVEKTGRVVRPVPAGSAHLTLAFLGDVDESAVAAIAAAMRTAAAMQAPLELTFSPPSVLMVRREPRAIIVPARTGGAELDQLANDLTVRLRSVEGLAELAMPKPGHITLARFGRSATPRDAERVRALLAATPWPAASIRVDTMTLLRSHLDPSGARYERLVAVPLGLAPFKPA